MDINSFCLTDTYEIEITNPFAKIIVKLRLRLPHFSAEWT